MYIDREFELLESLSKREMATQRELSQSLNISLGSVNMLLNKMQKEGLIKFRNLSARSVAYMLTPKGMAEKAEKTYQYVTYHYKRINDTKEKIKEYLKEKFEEEERIYLTDDAEMSQLVMLAAEELGMAERIRVVSGVEETGDGESGGGSVKDDGLLLLFRNDGKGSFEGRRTERVLEVI